MGAMKGFRTVLVAGDDGSEVMTDLFLIDLKRPVRVRRFALLLLADLVL